MGNNPTITEPDFDVIIKGAGPAGLNAALLHAGHGEKVLVVEKNNYPGGRHAWFRRGKYIFATTDISPEEFYTQESKIRGLGGSFRYKSRITAAVNYSDHTEVRLADGQVLSCRQLIGSVNSDCSEFTVWLGTDQPAESAGKECGERTVLRLSDDRMKERFANISERDYFRVKDEITEEIISDYEKRHGTDLHSHIVEMDAASPLTRYRYISDKAVDGLSCTAEDSLHPPVQFCKILQVTDRGHAKSFVIGPDPERGTTALACFRAGQYISILDRIGDAAVCKPYSICSSPKDALDKENPTYTVMIERNPDGFFSPHALDTWQPGTKLTISGPLGYFHYLRMRDARHMVALAGSSGITPFYSMAAAIADGIEDFDLTILYGSRTADSILLKNELDRIAERSGGRVRVVHVLSDEQRDGYESGFITPELIRKYAPAPDYSIFICGPKAMYDYLHRELPKLGLPERRIRFELPGEFGDPANDLKYPREAAGCVFRATVRERDTVKTIPCRSDQTLMQAIERAGIVIEADCRSGQCGWCRSLLLSGEVFIPESRESRHPADIRSGRIHPCVTYPLSNVEIEISNH